MKRLVPIIAATLALAACGGSADHGNNHSASAASSAPVFQLPVLPGRPGAAYLTVEVPTGHGALIGVTSPQAGRIEMHETVRQGSRTGMRMVERMAPENGRIALTRGGSHLMVYDVNPSLAAGGTAQLVLRFQNGQTMTLAARVVSPGGEHEGH